MLGVDCRGSTVRHKDLSKVIDFTTLFRLFVLVCLMEIRPCNDNDLGLDSYVMMVSAKAPTKEPIMLRFHVSSIPLGESYAHRLFPPLSMSGRW